MIVFETETVQTEICIDLFHFRFGIIRYVCILYPTKYNTFFSIRRTLQYSALTWILAIAIDAPNFMDGVGAHVYDTKALQCVFDRLKIGYTFTVRSTNVYINL